MFAKWHAVLPIKGIQLNWGRTNKTKQNKKKHALSWYTQKLHMTFSHYSSMNLACMWMSSAAGLERWGHVKQARWLRLPWIILPLHFVITCSSQSSSGLHMICSLTLIHQAGPHLQLCWGKVRLSGSRIYYGLGVHKLRHEQPSKSAADANHAWHRHLMWKTRVNKNPARGRNAQSLAGKVHVKQVLARLAIHSSLVKNWPEECPRPVVKATLVPPQDLLGVFSPLQL